MEGKVGIKVFVAMNSDRWKTVTDLVAEHRPNKTRQGCRTMASLYMRNGAYVEHGALRGGSGRFILNINESGK